MKVSSNFTENGPLHYVCLCCGEKAIIDNLNINIECSCTDDHHTLGILGGIASVDLICKNCNSSMYQIDKDLIDIIYTLNYKGFSTVYCCTGHRYDNSDPFIIFAYNKERNSYIKNVLMVGLFELDKDKLITVEYCNSFNNIDNDKRIFLSINKSIYNKNLLSDDELESLRYKWLDIVEKLSNKLKRID